MELFKNTLNICIDNFYENANLVINSFNPSYTTLFLFTSELLQNEDFVNCFPNTQIYTNNINIYLEKIFNQSINKPQYNKVIFFTGIPLQVLNNCIFYKNILNNLVEFNITVFLHIDNYKKIDYTNNTFNIFLPNPLPIDFAKRFCLSILNNNNWLHFINTHNSSEYIIYKKICNTWTFKKISQNIHPSKYLFPILDENCSSEKPIKRIIFNKKQKINIKTFDNDILEDNNNNLLEETNKKINLFNEIELEEKNNKYKTIIDLLNNF
jgi:hypothetical protein